MAQTHGLAPLPQVGDGVDGTFLRAPPGMRIAG